MMLFDLDQWRAWKDRLIASGKFHSAAISFPLSRPFARHYARSLFDICSGFVYSQILFAAVQLDLFRKLADGPRTAADIASSIDLPPERARLLLDACVSLRLMEKRSGGRYGLAPLGAAVLANPEVEAMVRHHALLYADLADPVGLLRHGSEGKRLSAFWKYAHTPAPSGLSAADVQEFSQLMAVSQAAIAGAILDAAPLDRQRCLLDIGGGEGVFMTAALRRTPGLRGILFDLPAVADRARQSLARSGLAGRVECLGGDFFGGVLPGGADITTMVRVAFDHDDARVLSILRAAYAALQKPGRILIAEPMSTPDHPDRISSAYFAFYLMAMGHGRARSLDEISELLRAAGFSNCRPIPVPKSLVTTLVIADAH